MVSLVFLTSVSELLNFTGVNSRTGILNTSICVIQC